MNEPVDLGAKTNVDVMTSFVSLTGKKIMDIGCGDLSFTKVLVELGAEVVAIDPDPIQAELNRANEVAGIEFHETGGDRLPAESQSVDGIMFAYSLHHIPEILYSAVFKEVLRVLKPTGFLYFIEPTDGRLNDVMKLFHDEDQERLAAKSALRELLVPKFENVSIVRYFSVVHYRGFDEFADHFISRSFNTLYSEDDVRAPQVKQAFESLGKSNADLKEKAYSFRAVKLAYFLTSLKS